MLAPRRLVVLREFVAQGTIAGAAEALRSRPRRSRSSSRSSSARRASSCSARRGRRLELTDAGRMLAARAGGVLAELEQLEAGLAWLAGEVRGVVRVARSRPRRARWSCPRSGGSRPRHPELRVELIELEAEESLPVLARGGVDVAIAEEYEHAPRPHLPELHRDYLAADELVLTLPRGLLARRRAGAAGLAPRAAVGDRAGRDPLRRHVRARRAARRPASSRSSTTA